MLARAHKSQAAKPTPTPTRRRVARRPRARAGARATESGAAPAAARAAPSAATSTPTVVQAKLRVSEPGDALEREADRVADEVVRTVATGATAAADAPPGDDGANGAGPSPATVARACAGCESDEELQRLDEDRVPIEGTEGEEHIDRACAPCAGADEEVQRLDEDRVAVEGDEPMEQLDRACASCAEDEEVDRACASCEEEADRAPAADSAPKGGLARASNDTLVATPVLETEIAALRRDGGRPLAPPLRATLEPAMKTDLGAVRIHTGPRAARAASLARARAFTVGRDVVFAADAYRPTTRSGLHLLAHELAHTVQQTGGVARKPMPRVRTCPVALPRDSQLRNDFFIDLDLRRLRDGKNVAAPRAPAIRAIQSFLVSRLCSQLETAKMLRENAGSILGTESKRALELYQKAKTLSETGKPDSATIRAMSEDLRLRRIVASCRPPAGRARHRPRVPQRVVEEHTSRQRRWRLVDFDVDEHFLQPEHRRAFQKPAHQTSASRPKTIPEEITDALAIRRATGKDPRIQVFGNTSETGTESHNLALSDRRALCVAAALVDAKINPGVIEGLGKANARGGERPADRNVIINVDIDCDALATRRTSMYRARFACTNSDALMVQVIGDDPVPDAAHRNFLWTPVDPSFSQPAGAKNCGVLSDCDYVPEGDPTKHIPVHRGARPLALAVDHPQSAAAGSDFEGAVTLRQQTDSPRLEHDRQRFDVALPGAWNPPLCELLLPLCTPVSRRGRLIPVGPVSCAPPVALPRTPCRDPDEPDEDCPESRGLATKLVARFEVLDRGETPIPFVSEGIAAHLYIGTAKSADEKKRSGEDSWVRHELLGASGRHPCENRFAEGTTTEGEATLDRPRRLTDIKDNVFTVTRRGGSNEDVLTFDGIKFVLHGERCFEGTEQSAPFARLDTTELRCDKALTITRRGRETCEGNCPQARLTCPDERFDLEFFRVPPGKTPPSAKKRLQHYDCPEVAIVRARTHREPHAWRRFVWIQDAGCPFGIEDRDTTGYSVEVKVDLVDLLRRRLLRSLGGGLVGRRLATRDPRDPAAPSDFSGQTMLIQGQLIFAFEPLDVDLWTLSPSLKMSGIVLARPPIDWRADCRTTSTGVLIPDGPAMCEPPPVPTHQPRPKPPSWCSKAASRSSLGSLGSSDILDEIKKPPEALVHPKDYERLMAIAPRVRGRVKPNGVNAPVPLALWAKTTCGEPAFVFIHYDVLWQAGQLILIDILGPACTLGADGKPRFFAKDELDRETFPQGPQFVSPRKFSK